MKQESRGSFIPHVFICRIGSSLYFANASFVKDMILAYVEDLEDVNPTEYMVIEMTPVVSVDSTACHVIKDIVNDFRNRGLQVAFAMVGNRVEKTMRKAGLRSFIGEQWFFPTVEEAVIYCIKHQHAKKMKAAQNSMEDTDTDAIDITSIKVHAGNEIGFSNDLHASCSMVFVNLVKDVPMIMSDLTAVFRRNHITIIRAQIDPLEDSGAKHIYFIKSIKSGSKLNELETQRVREDLEVVLQKHKLLLSDHHEIDRSPSRVSFADDRSTDKMFRLEQRLEEQMETTRMMQARLDEIRLGPGTCLPMPCGGRSLVGKAQPPKSP